MKTAVENYHYRVIDLLDLSPTQFSKLEEFLTESKEIEKQQIINAYDCASGENLMYKDKQASGDDYYNYLINDFSE